MMDTIYSILGAILPLEAYQYSFMKNAFLAILLLTPLLGLLGTMAVNHQMAGDPAADPAPGPAGHHGGQSPDGFLLRRAGPFRPHRYRPGHHPRLAERSGCHAGFRDHLGHPDLRHQAVRLRFHRYRHFRILLHLRGCGSADPRPGRKVCEVFLPADRRRTGRHPVRPALAAPGPHRHAGPVGPAV